MKPSNAKAQRARLLAWLQQRPCSTFEARHKLDIPAPAPRIYELRHEYGHNVQTCWVDEINPGGGMHRVAQYVLFPGKYDRRVQHV